MLKLPKPESLTSSPVSRVFWIRSKKPSTMSFDSRLLRPSRSNSSSDSSALVKVGVSSVSRSMRLRTGSGEFIEEGLSGAQPGTDALSKRGEHVGDDIVDALVGQRGLVIPDLEPDREA